MRRSTAYRLIGAYSLVAIVVSMGPTGPLSVQRVQYPTVLCSSIGVPGVPFRFSICTQRQVYVQGEIANITLSAISTANTSLITKDSMSLVIGDNLRTVFSDSYLCFIPEGCEYYLGGAHSGVFRWKTEQLGNYMAEGTFATRICSTDCGPPIASGSSKIGLSFAVI